MPQDSPSRDQNKFIVRMPEGLRERIATAAKANNRSMNAEIVKVLESNYPVRPPLRTVLRELSTALASLTNAQKRSLNKYHLEDQLVVLLEELKADPSERAPDD